MSVCLSVCLSACLPACLSVCLPVCCVPGLDTLQYEMEVEMETSVAIPADTLRTAAGEAQFIAGVAAAAGVSVSQISGAEKRAF
jgi:hypothetical protein